MTDTLLATPRFKFIIKSTSTYVMYGEKKQNLAVRMGSKLCMKSKHECEIQFLICLSSVGFYFIMQILVLLTIALVQLFGKRRYVSFVNAQDESLIDLLELTTTDSNQRRVLLGKGNKVTNGKAKESVKDIFNGLKAKAKGKGAKSKKAPKGGKGGGVGGARPPDGGDLSPTTCRLCESGVSVGNPNAIVVANNDYVNELNNVTCSKLDSFLASYVQPYEGFCDEAHYSYSDTCGCCPGICTNGERMSYPNKIVPFDVNDNGIYDDTCADLNTFFKSYVGGTDCYLAYIASEYCGCKTYQSVCTPCYNNAAMPNYNKVVYSDTEYYYYYDDDYMSSNSTGYTYNYTCGESAMDTLSFFYTPSLGCALRQATYGAILCDCPSTPPSIQSSCTLCFANETLSTSSEPIFDGLSCTGLNALGVYFGSILVDNTCDESKLTNELLVNYTENGRATCCTPKTTGSNSNQKAKPSAKNTAKNSIDWKAKKEVAESIIAEIKKKLKSSK